MANYKHGEMDITSHEKTYHGFITFVTRTVIAIIVFLIFLALLNA